MFLTNENKEVHVQAQKAPLISPSEPLSAGASGPAAPHRCCDCHQTHHSSNSAQSSAFSDVFSASASGFLAADSGPVRLRLLAPGWYNWIAGRSWRDGGKSFRQVDGRIVWKAVVLTLFRSRSLFSSFLSSLADFMAFSEGSPRFSHFFLSTLRSLSFLTSSSCFLHEFSASCRSLLLCRSSSRRLRRSFSFCRRSFSRSLSWSVSRSLNSFRPCSSVL